VTGLATVSLIAFETLITFALTFVLAWAVIGFFWLFGPRIQFPKRAILIVAIVFTLPTIVRGISTAVRQLPQSEVIAQARAANTAFEATIANTLSRDQLRAQLSSLDIERWPPEVVDHMTAGIMTKAIRYGDVHQSMLHGTVMRTPPFGRGAELAVSSHELDPPSLASMTQLRVVFSRA
jgi:hypothetical protein